MRDHPPALSSRSGSEMSLNEELKNYLRNQAKFEKEPSSTEANEVSLSSSRDSSPNSTASPNGIRHKGRQIVEKVLQALDHARQRVGHKLHSFEDFMFPNTAQVGSPSYRYAHPTVALTPKGKGRVLLRGCLDYDEHRQRVRELIELLRPLRGEKGLRALGFEYKLVPVDYKNSEEDENTEEIPVLAEDNLESCEQVAEDIDPDTMMNRLFHSNTNVMITQENRNEYIADGDMYDAVARICQEYAQEVMIREGDLEWAIVDEAGNNPEPIRALVSKSMSEDDSILDRKPTLLIVTGKGKVRAGIFSRQHLLTLGMECSTALPMVKEAQKRNMNVVILDPNVHGDRLGMITFEKSMARLFRRWEQDEVSDISRSPFVNRDFFVLSHSQSGAQLARYLLEKSQHYVPHIRAIAFTDSTHNIAWTRDNEELHSLLQSEICAYWKVSNEQNEILTPLPSVGRQLETDEVWEDRFGRISTRCAGTSEHSLTNWFARSHIWNHFDTFLHRLSSKDSLLQVDESNSEL